jgi:hypothetical protein
MVFLVIRLSGFQPFCNKIDIPFGRPDAHQDYSSSGIFKQVCDLGDDLQRGNGRGNRASREVFPLCCIQSNIHREL